MQYKMLYHTVHGSKFAPDKHYDFDHFLDRFLEDGWEPQSVSVIKVDENKDDAQYNLYHLAILIRKKSN